MIDSFDYYNPDPNHEVTEYYCSIIIKSLGYFNIEVSSISQIVEKDNSDKGIIVVTLRDALLAKKAKYGYVITWIQGIEPEEYWLKHSDLCRYVYYSFRESRALKATDLILYCSEAMKRHYEKKYFFNSKIDYIMPCFNDEVSLDRSIHQKENVFAYAGSLEKWQCFEKTVLLYKSIERHIPNAKMCVYVKDSKTAKELLDKYEIENYEIAYFNHKDLEYELKKAKFGFCIRDDIEVNRVATPTKLSNYISLGIIPVYSKCLSSFYNKSKNNPYCVCVDEDGWLDKIINISNMEIDCSELLQSYSEFYRDYYSKEYHSDKLIQIMQQQEAFK